MDFSLVTAEVDSDPAPGSSFRGQPSEASGHSITGSRGRKRRRLMHLTDSADPSFSRLDDNDSSDSGEERQRKDASIEARRARDRLRRIQELHSQGGSVNVVPPPQSCHCPFAVPFDSTQFVNPHFPHTRNHHPHWVRLPARPFATRYPQYHSRRPRPRPRPPQPGLSSTSYNIAPQQQHPIPSPQEFRFVYFYHDHFVNPLPTPRVIANGESPSWVPQEGPLSFLRRREAEDLAEAQARSLHDFGAECHNARFPIPKAPVAPPSSTGFIRSIKPLSTGDSSAVCTGCSCSIMGAGIRLYIRDCGHAYCHTCASGSPDAKCVADHCLIPTVGTFREVFL